MAGRRPVLPEAIEYIFDYFRELCWTRRPGFSGPLSLEYQEIEAWCRLTRRTLEQWELRILLEMDVAYIRSLQKKDDEEKTVESTFSGEVVSARPLSPELFDALFVSNDNVRSR